MTAFDNNEQTSNIAEARLANARALRKERIGRVISARMKGTCVVEAVNRVPHFRFGKIVKHRKRYYVHDEENTARIGDMVRICETRRISKLKCWRLVEILEASN